MPSIREVFELLKKGATLEAQQQLVELQEAHIKLREENIALRAEVARLTDELKGASELSWREPFYWKGADGPFCQVCFETDHKKIRLGKHREEGYNAFQCAVCGGRWIGKGNPSA